MQRRRRCIKWEFANCVCWAVTSIIFGLISTCRYNSHNLLTLFMRLYHNPNCNEQLSHFQVLSHMLRLNMKHVDIRCILQMYYRSRLQILINISRKIEKKTICLEWDEVWSALWLFHFRLTNSPYRFWRLKSIPALKELINYNGRRYITYRYSN